MRLSKIPGGRLVSPLSHRVTYVRLVRLVKTPGVRLFRALPARSRFIRLAR